MSRPGQSRESVESEIAKLSTPHKYDGLNEFNATKPPSLEKKVVATAFHQMDTDRDSFIDLEDLLNALQIHKEIALTNDILEAM
jgi:hypothetical protein